MRDIFVILMVNGQGYQTYDLSGACYRLADFLIASVPRALPLPLVGKAFLLFQF
jgi:hypothetical protein